MHYQDATGTGDRRRGFNGDKRGSGSGGMNNRRSNNDREGNDVCTSLDRGIYEGCYIIYFIIKVLYFPILNMP